MDKIDEKVDELKAMLEGIELETMQYTLADAIREGSSVSEQAYEWGNGESLCTMSAAVVAAISRGYIQK